MDFEEIVLKRLDEGPATTKELAGLGGFADGRQIAWDLRRWASHGKIKPTTIHGPRGGAKPGWAKVAAVLLFLLALSTIATPAHAGILDRLKAVGHAVAGDLNSVAGTVMTEPKAVGDGGASEVLVFSTTIGDPITWVRFSPADRQKVQKTVKAGSTLTVLASNPATVAGGFKVLEAVRWRSEVEGNPLRRDFVLRYRWPILVYAMRDQPEVLQHFFSDGFPSDFYALAQQLPKVAAALRGLGVSVADGGTGTPEVTQAARPASVRAEELRCWPVLSEVDHHLDLMTQHVMVSGCDPDALLREIFETRRLIPSSPGGE